MISCHGTLGRLSDMLLNSSGTIGISQGARRIACRWTNRNNNSCFSRLWEWLVRRDAGQSRSWAGPPPQRLVRFHSINGNLQISDQLFPGSSRQLSIRKPTDLSIRFRIRQAKTQSAASRDGSTITGYAKTQYRTLSRKTGVKMAWGLDSSAKSFAHFL